MDQNLSTTITIAEAAVAVVALVGLVAAAYNLMSAWADGRIQRAAGVNGHKRRLVNWAVREELFRVIKLSIFLAASTVAMTAPSSTNTTARTASTIILWLLFALECLMVLGTLWAVYDRIRIRGDWEEEDREKQELIHRAESAESLVVEATTRAEELATVAEELAITVEEDKAKAAAEQWDGKTERRKPPTYCPWCDKQIEDVEGHYHKLPTESGESGGDTTPPGGALGALESHGEPRNVKEV